MMMSLRTIASRSAVLSRCSTTAAMLARPTTSSFRRSIVTKRYTTDHEWISFDDSNGVGTMGITDYAQKALGDVVYVELPSLETQVAAGEQIGAVESVKAASDIFAPVSGQVQQVNEALGDAPDLLNKSPEQDGWLAKIKLSNPGEFEQLLSDTAYKAHCEGHAESSD